MATYYWVGGAGTWDNATKTNWATVSGGAGGNGPPTNADTVNFDSNSGSGTVNVTATAVSLSTTQNKVDITLSLSGNAVLCTSAGTFTHTTGIVTLNSYSMSVGRFISANANARTINFGTGNITLTTNSNTIWSTSNVTGLVISGTPTVNCTYSGATGTRAFNPGALGEAYALNINVSAGTDIFSIGTTTNGVKNLNFTGFSGSLANTTYTIYGNLVGSTGMTWAAGANATTFAATSGTQQITTAGKTLDFPITQNSPGATLQLQDNLTMGSTRTFTLTAGTLDLTGNAGNWTLSTGLFSSSNSNTRSIAFGTGQITVTGNNGNVFNFNTATNFTYTGTSNVVSNYSGSTGTRSFFLGGAAGGSETNAVNLYITAGSDTVAVGNPFHARTLGFTGFSGTLTNQSRFIYGNLIFSSGMSFNSGTSVTAFVGTSGTQQITTNGKTLDFPIAIEGVGTTVAFQDALTQGSTRNFTLTNGTVQLKNGVTSTVGNFVTSGTNQKFLQSTTPGSQATLSEAVGTVDASYLTIRDINATGGATWNAYVNQFNVDAGNNDGWDFGISPIVGSYEYTYQLRSFTQPRRF